VTRRIRVMHVIARMNVGGPAVLIASTMRGVNSDEFDCRLVTGYCAEDEADHLLTQAPDISATRIDGLGRSIKPWADASSVAAVMSQMREFRPDIVHTHTAKAGVVGRTAARLVSRDIKVVHTYHGHLLHGYFSPAKTRVVTGLERSLAHVTDRLVSVAEQVRDDLLAAGIGRPSQHEVILPGVDLGPLPPREEARATLGITGSGPVVTMMGRITGIKRPDRFAAAARLVAASRSDVTFAVAGAGDQADALADLVSDLPVHILGWRDDIETVLAASDVLVLTSDNEGTPLSLIQAGLAGIPVVATNVGAVRTVVDDGITGVLCEPDSTAEAKSLERLLDDPIAASAMGERAREAMTSRFGMGRMIIEHENLYRRLLA